MSPWALFMDLSSLTLKKRYSLAQIFNKAQLSATAQGTFKINRPVIWTCTCKRLVIIKITKFLCEDKPISLILRWFFPTSMPYWLKSRLLSDVGDLEAPGVGGSSVPYFHQQCTLFFYSQVIAPRHPLPLDTLIDTSSLRAPQAPKSSSWFLQLMLSLPSISPQHHICGLGKHGSFFQFKTKQQSKSLIRL